MPKHDTIATPSTSAPCHFYAMAAQMMRQILIDQARKGAIVS
jgi:ECF sigma factor